MYTYKFTCGSDELYGQICHNYATACNEATNYVQALVNSGWAVSSGNMDLIQEPYDIILNMDGKIARVVVGKLTFAQV